MKETEGIIKFSLDYSESTIPEPLTNLCRERLSSLNAWRNILIQLGLLGQDPQRYGGYGFGNMSIRCQPGQDPFLITGSQTGMLDNLKQKHFSLVTKANTELNSISATGEILPSSEALTHAAIYSAAPTVHSVIHIHFPLIWQMTQQLQLSATDSNIAYGTPAMAKAVTSLVKDQPSDLPVVFSMLGHEDGVVAYGKKTDQVAHQLINVLAKCLQDEASSSTDLSRW